MSAIDVAPNWPRKRLKYVANIVAGQSADGALVNNVAEGVPFLQGCAEFGRKSPNADRYCTAPPKRAPAGSWLVSVRAPVGRTNFADQEYGIGRGLAAIQANAIDLGFLGYVLDDSASRLNSYATGSTFLAINGDQLGSIDVPTPPLETQKRIAAFLDEKTAQIDALIEKKQALLERLAEKRQAIITQAVTKGLNPAAPMKPSGIDWLGDIPAHWEVKRLRFLLDGDTLNGLYKPKDQFQDDGVPFVQMGEAFRDVQFSGGTKDRVLSNPSEQRNWGLRSGDFLIARRSLVFEGSGKSVLIGATDEPHLFESSMIRLRPADPSFSVFMSSYFQSTICRAFILSITKQVTISGIDSQQLKNVPIPCPPEDEANQINEYLSRTKVHLDKVTQSIKCLATRLTEYRSALITAAVIGQMEI